MLEDQHELRNAIIDVERSIADWSSAFACMASPLGEIERAMRMMLQIQFMSVSIQSASKTVPSHHKLTLSVTDMDSFYAMAWNSRDKVRSLLSNLPPDNRRHRGPSGSPTGSHTTRLRRSATRRRHIVAPCRSRHRDKSSTIPHLCQVSRLCHQMESSVDAS